MNRSLMLMLYLTVCPLMGEEAFKPINAKSVIEAIEFTSPRLSDELRKQILAIHDPDDMIRFHHGLGTWVRNNCGLWQDDSGIMAMLKEKAMDFDGHPDSASHIVLCALWAYEKGRAKVKHSKRDVAADADPQHTEKGAGRNSEEGLPNGETSVGQGDSVDSK